MGVWIKLKTTIFLSFFFSSILGYHPQKQNLSYFTKKAQGQSLLPQSSHTERWVPRELSNYLALSPIYVGLPLKRDHMPYPIRVGVRIKAMISVDGTVFRNVCTCTHTDERLFKSFPQTSFGVFILDGTFSKAF